MDDTARPGQANPPDATHPSRRLFLGGLASAAFVDARSTPARAYAIPGGYYTAREVALRDAANVAASAQSNRGLAGRYQPLTGGIVHFFGYGQSLAGGFYGEPLLSITQPYDNLMIGQSTHAVSHAVDNTDWVPVGTPDANGIYPFEPMTATISGPYFPAPGETPGEGAINFLRRAYLRRLHLNANSNCRFVLTNCAAGGKTISELQKGADPETFNLLRTAATCVKASAESMGLSYQVGGVIFTHGEDDVLHGTSYADYLSGLKTLQQSFLTDIVQTIGGQPPGVVVPWFCDQPSSRNSRFSNDVYQALLDWSDTNLSDFYMAGPLYQYPNHNVHLTANGYRWHSNQVGKAMASVLLLNRYWHALHMTGATFVGTSVLVNLSVPFPPLVTGDSYDLYTKFAYPNLGFTISDAGGPVPITAVAIVGQATVQIQLGRLLQASPVLQAGISVSNGDIGTNLCDSDRTVANDPYVYQDGIQDAGEDIPTWNGAPLIGSPYPMANYLAVSAVAITPD